MKTSLATLALLAASFTLTACAKPAAAEHPADPVAAATAPTAVVAEAVHTKELGPCDLVTQAEMRAIMHGPVVARVNDHHCLYQYKGLYADVELDRGDGAVAMNASHVAGKMETGLDNPLAGIGDAATAVGPMVSIRTGDDLVQIILYGVDDPIPAIKKIFKAVKSRM